MSSVHLLTAGNTVILAGTLIFTQHDNLIQADHQKLTESDIDKLRNDHVGRCETRKGAGRGQLQGYRAACGQLSRREAHPRQTVCSVPWLFKYRVTSS